jgi:hypothetical protein
MGQKNPTLQKLLIDTSPPGPAAWQEDEPRRWRAWKRAASAALKISIAGALLLPALGVAPVGRAMKGAPAERRGRQAQANPAVQRALAALPLAPDALPGEFRANTYTPGNQELPAVALDAVGNFAAAWASYGQDGSGPGIYAQRFDKNGLPLGGEFRANTFTTGDQRVPCVAMDADGDFVVAWQSLYQDGSLTGIYAQRFDKTGVSQGTEMLVNTYTTGDQLSPAVALDADGDFVVAWASIGQDGSSSGIYARRFDNRGIPQGGEFRANTYTTGDQSSPAVALDADGDFIIAWASDGQDGSRSGIYAQRFDNSGIPQGVEFRANTYTSNGQDLPSVDMDADGDFVIAWQSENQEDEGYLNIYAQRFNNSGVPQGGEFRANSFALATFDPAVAMDADGDFAITWASYSQDGSEDGVFGQAFRRDGAPVLGEFRANTETANNQRRPAVDMDADGDLVIAWQSLYQDGSDWGIYAQRMDLGSLDYPINTYTTSYQLYPAVAMDDAGNFVAAWISDGQDEANFGVYAQRFDQNGVPLGGEFRVNTYTSSDQSQPVVAMDADGDFVIAWQSNGQDENYGYGIYAQRYDHNGVSVGGEFRANEYTTGSQEQPAIAMDAGGNFIIAWSSDGQDGASFGIYARRYANNGAALGGEFRANTCTTGNQTNPALAADADSDFVIAWQSNGQDGSSNGIFAQRFNNSGIPQGAEFRANTYTTNQQEMPAAAMDESGKFIIAWQSNGQDGWSTGIYAKRYAANGSAVSSEFRANTYTTSMQSRPVVTMDADGDFIVAWQSDGQDGSSHGVYAQNYNKNGEVKGKEFRANSYTTGDQSYPAAAMDASGDFVLAWASYGLGNPPSPHRLSPQEDSDFAIAATRFTEGGAPLPMGYPHQVFMPMVRK